MSKICYVHKNFSKSSKAIIVKANQILDEYAAQGFVLTLRQLYQVRDDKQWERDEKEKNKVKKRLKELALNWNSKNGGEK